MTKTNLNRGGCWVLDDTKMGQTYIRWNLANTLAARDYKSGQVVLRVDEDAEDNRNTKPWSASGGL